MLYIILLVAFAGVAQSAPPCYYTIWNDVSITEFGVTKYVGIINVNGFNVTVKFTPTKPVTVQTSGQNWWGKGTIATNLPSPYTSLIVENDPTPSNMIQMREVLTNNIIEFSVPVGGVVVSVVSINKNTYTFDRDFVILSQSDGIQWSSGAWGIGNLSKTVSGSSYSLVGIGNEPHGAIQLLGTLTSFSLSNSYAEVWNGFTVGVQSIVPPPPPPPPSCLPNLYCSKILDGIPRKNQAKDSTCTLANSGTITFTVQTSGQPVYLTADPKGVSPYFDDMAIISVLSPKKILKGKNLHYWNEECKNASYTTLTVNTPGAIDITSLFGGEIGDFIVTLQLFNKYNPFQNENTWICTGSSFPKSAPGTIAVTTDPTISSTVVTGFSGAEVAAIAVGSVIGTVLLIAVVAAVGYTINKKKTSSDIDIG